jgi:protein-S-isoprenylcysteine O-methyltransferase Ste14
MPTHNVAAHGARSNVDVLVRHLKRLVPVADTFLSMSGFRIGHMTPLWAVGGALSLAVGQSLIELKNPSYTISYYIVSIVFYYGGNSLVLASKLAKLAIGRYGERRAFQIYETMLALMFVNQGLGVGCMTSLTTESSFMLNFPLWLAYGIGGSLFAVGLVVKVWSTLVLGVDIYYYRDMFLGRPVSSFVSRGPYKLFSNPMYGVGQLHGYGYALWHRSFAGLIAIGVCHALIYVFYFAVERPFVKRVYFGHVVRLPSR